MVIDSKHLLNYISLGKGMPYLPATASLAATHKGKISNIRAAALKQGKEDTIAEAVIATFEDETLKYDRSQKDCHGTLGKKPLFVTVGNVYYHHSFDVEHMENYAQLGHPYIADYSLSPDFTWVLSMSPMMSHILSKAEYIEVDATFKGSIELEYLFNVVTFDYDSLKCEW